MSDFSLTLSDLEAFRDRILADAARRGRRARHARVAFTLFLLGTVLATSAWEGSRVWHGKYSHETLELEQARVLLASPVEDRRVSLAALRKLRATAADAVHELRKVQSSSNKELSDRAKRYLSLLVKQALDEGEN